MLPSHLPLVCAPCMQCAVIVQTLVGGETHYCACALACLCARAHMRASVCRSHCLLLVETSSRRARPCLAVTDRAQFAASACTCCGGVCRDCSAVCLRACWS